MLRYIVGESDNWEYPENEDDTPYSFDHSDDDIDELRFVKKRYTG